MKKMKRINTIFLFIMICGVGTAQELIGSVVDEFHRPFQEVHILNKSNDSHTHSNERGSFVFENISIGDTLLFSHIGYESKRLIVEELNRSILVILQPKSIGLDEVIVEPRTNVLKMITDFDVQINPVNSSQEILQKAPGLFIGQHAGGGKAEQIFLRGFDIDHGTDINLSVDGLPVNMVSHAHGQGYADLHFIIPETIDQFDFGKGPYEESKGNFATAGYIDLKTKSQLDKSSVKIEAGQFNSYRLLGMFNLMETHSEKAYIASEFQATDGPFDSPQHFNRLNFFGKYSKSISKNKNLRITSSYFNSKWDASGQIPVRAVESGLIGRFGAIDDTEGGNTSRSNIALNYNQVLDANTSLKSMIYLSQYDFELYSNFTFFLDDTINGDQIKQKEKRNIYGIQSELKRSFNTSGIAVHWSLGIDLRYDNIESNELSHTKNRKEILEYLRLGDIHETNAATYLGSSFILDKWTLSPSLRMDLIDFEYNDQLSNLYSTQSESKIIASPKFNLAYNHSSKLQAYVKMGKGFHSNDTRVVVSENGNRILPAAYGYDVGVVWKPVPNMLFNLTYWYLFLEQEFVYVGDAGIVEPSGKTQRQGLELTYRYQPCSWLYYNLDVNYTHARALDIEDGQDYIPLAPDLTLVSSINWRHQSGVYGSMDLRFIDDRPANEDNSIIAEGYAVVDLNIGYKWRKVNFGIQIQNLFNTEWNETQFATESRLQNEVDPVEEIHFTPGTPFFIKSMIQFNF